MYATVLRDPLHRAISNLAYQHANAAKVADVHQMLRPDWGYFSDHDTKLIEFSTATFDNFHVRTLAGPDVFMLPAGHVTKTHLEQAKERLRQFSIVIVLEEWKVHSSQLSSLLGWQRLSVPCDQRSAFVEDWMFWNLCAHRSSTHWLAQLKLEDARADEYLTGEWSQRNALDFELYRFGRHVALNRTRELELRVNVTTFS